MENSPNAGPTTESASVQDASNTIPRFSFLYSNPAYPARVYRVSLAYDGQAYTPRCRIEIRDAIATNCEHPFSAGPLTRDSLCAALTAEAQARYRQTVLDAMQQVQDGVTGLSVLDTAARQAHAAVDDARRLVDMAHERYAGGMTAFIDVISAQQQLQTSREQEVAIHGRQLATLVYLAKALGGGWQAQASTQGTPEIAAQAAN